MDVKEKVILVTGGAGGIGFATTKKLLQNGAKGVAVVDICKEAGMKVVTEFTKTFGEKRIIFIKTDVSVKKELEEAFEYTIKVFKQLDIVVNNAGIVNEFDWKQTITINLIAVIEGTYLAMEKYLPKHKSGEEGVIVNTASVLGLTTMQVSPVYCATKHGLIGLGRAVGGQKFYNKYKVRVLTLCPGVIDTPMISETKVFFSEKKGEEIQALNPVLQSPDCVGEALIEIIRRGKNGSIWVTEDNTPVYEVVVPNYKTMKVEN